MSTRATARASTARRPRPAPRPQARPRPRPRAVARPRTRTRMRLGPLVIPIIALVLGGIVWVNVAKLSLTNDTGKVMERSRGVEAQTARLQSQLDQLDARVRENAMKRLGMVMPSGDSVTYLDPLARP
ncbi:MAG: hypothetical protein AB7O78_00885 [Thermoleophilia bacterium]